MLIDFILSLSVSFLKMYLCVVDEGYQRRVTVDDEDSSILVFDSWKQVRHCFFILSFI